MKTQGDRRPRAARGRPVTLALTLAVAAACGGGSAHDSGGSARTDVPFDSVYASARSGVDAPLRSVVRDAEAWAAAWPALSADRSPTPPLPGVDFGQDMLIAAGLGTRRSGGYAVRIAGIAAVGESLRVTVLEVAPGPGCMATMALTAPVAVVRVARRDGDVEFVEAREERPCD